MDADYNLDSDLMNSPMDDKHLPGRNSANLYGIWTYRMDYFQQV